MMALAPLSDLLVTAGAVARLGSQGLQQIRQGVGCLSDRLDTFEVSATANLVLSKW